MAQFLKFSSQRLTNGGIEYWHHEIIEKLDKMFHQPRSVFKPSAIYQSK